MSYQIGKVYLRNDRLIYVTGTRYIKSLDITFFTWKNVKPNGKLQEDGEGISMPGLPINCDVQIKINFRE